MPVRASPKYKSFLMHCVLIIEKSLLWLVTDYPRQLFSPKAATQGPTFSISGLY